MRSTLVALLGATVLLVGACSGSGTTSSQSDSRGLAHIHGLGVNPADGALYAGTHYGVYRLANERDPELVGDIVQDFMGFTVAGPDHFLASGHPGEGQGGPGSVGLIESDDAGESWNELSLSGEADFHALEYRHGRVYGLNSMTGQLLVSGDMKSWEELSRTPIADFAVSPTDPEVLLATTEQGLARSTDGGRTFETLAAAPLMVFVSWAEDGALAGVTPDGVVYTAEDPAGEWSKRGSLDGRPEALTVQSAKAIYAAANGTVLLSTDGGGTFATLLTK